MVTSRVDLIEEPCAQIIGGTGTVPRLFPTLA